MKKLCLFAAFSMITLFSACESSEMMRGVITHVGLSGGFYGIITPEGEQYVPTNLPEEFMEDGIEVEFRGKVQEEMVGIQMWGKYIELEEIKRAQ